MKRRLIMLLMFLCVMYGNLWAIDVITNGNGLVKSENFVSNRASDENVQEIWSGNAKMGFNFSQTTDLPNGVYTLSVQAMYRADKEKGTATNCALYAETTGKVYNAPIANFGDCDNTTESLSGVANVMRSDASNYANSIPYIIVTDGRVNVGVRSLGALTYCTNGYWFIWDPSTFRLSEVTDTEVLEKALESVKSEALEILDNAQETDARAELQSAYDNAVATSEGIVALKEAVRAYYPHLATADNPIDVSFLMVNPKYEEKALVVATNSTGGSAAYPLLQPAGWLCEDNVTAENAFHYFHVVDANETFDGNSNTAYDDGNTLYMRFAWNGAAPRISAKQTIRLPEGTYKLSVPARKNGNDITVTVKYTFAGSEEVQTVTDWKAYEKMFTINNENKEITVELGFAREDVNVATQQAYFGGVTLWAYGDPLAAGRKSLQQEMDALKAYTGMVPSGLWASDGLYGKALAEAEVLMVEASDAAELENMVVTLRGLSDEAEKMKSFYVSLNELIALCSGCVGEDNSVVADEAVRTTFNVAIETAKNVCESAQKASDLEGACTALETARQDFVMSAEPVNGCVFDMTFTVQNADFSATGSWSETPALNYGVAEFYNKEFVMYQTITGLPNGEYQLSCQGFYRPGGTGDVMNNSDKMYVRLYANEESSPLMSIMDDAGKEGMTENGGTYIDGKLVPNNMASGATAFSAGLYNENVVKVVVANGTLTVGLKKETTIGSDWTLFDNFRLLKLNALAVDEVYGTIEAWKAKANALVDTKPLGNNENEALKDALAAAEDLSGKTTFELNQIVASLQKAVEAVEPWREAYETAKVPLVEAFERFERDFNDGENGALRPMSTEVWNTLLDAVKVAATAKDVTDSYDGFADAAKTFGAAMDATEQSIKLYAGYSHLVEGLNGLGDADLSATVGTVDPAARESDDLIQQAFTSLDEAFAVYKNKQNGGFSVDVMLGDNLDFETETTVTDARNSQVYEIPGWDNEFVSDPTDGNLQYVFRTLTTDVAEGVATAHSLRMRSKWDQINTKIQISKEGYLPSGEYELSFYMKEPQTSGIIENLCYYELDGVRTEFTASTSWERKTINLTVEKPMAFKLSFGFVRDTKSGDGHDAEVYVDDVTLTCHAQTAFARALAAAGNEENSLAAQSAYNEYKDAVEAEMAEDVKTEAIEVLNNAVKIAQSGEVATLLIKNADFTGGTDNLPLKGSGGSVSKPKDWTFEYDYEGWNDTFVTTEDGVNIFNCWAGVIKRGELMQTLTALPNGVYRLSAELVSDVVDGSSWVALYGAPANGEIARAENVKEADAYGSYEVFFKVVDHHATIGVRSDAHYFKLRNIALEYVADNEENAVKTDNGRMLQYAYVNRNNAEVDLTGFDKANGATVYLTKKNALIKAASAEQVANQKNVIVDGVCENFELTDRESFAASEAFTAKNALYTRTMANEWGTLVLPYAVASNEQVKYYKLIATRLDGEDSYMTFSLVDELPANTPCAFRRMDAEEQVNFGAVEVTIEPVTTRTVEIETDLVGWAVDGYYEKVTVEEPEELGRTYYISNNTFMNATKSLEILPFRATFVNSEVNGVNRFLIDFSDGTNGVENASLRASLSVFAETGMLRMVAGADVRYAVYTLGGMLVEQGMLQAGEEHLLKLASGIYIVNGLKVQVR